MFPEPRYIDTNGISMAVYEQGEGAPVMFLHGFPELAFSWRYQLPEFAAAGYRAIAMDQRGYGNTTVPPNVEDYRIEELLADIEGLLDAFGLDSAVFVGHDWGALVLWYLAMLRPERIDKLVQLNIPHSPRPPIDPIEIFRQRFGEHFYIVDFQNSQDADREFEANPRQFLNLMMRKNQISRAQFEQLPPELQVISLRRTMANNAPGGDPLLSDEELDYFEAAYKKSGFTGPINRYRNWTRNWEILDGIDPVIELPTLFIGAVDDVVIPLDAIERMRSVVPGVEIHMLEPCGHWSQQERPSDVNRLILDWLK